MNRLTLLFLVLLCTVNSFAQDEKLSSIVSNDREAVLADLYQLVEGHPEFALDSFDVEIVNMNPVFHQMFKDTSTLYDMTYADLLNEIQSYKETPYSDYNEIREGYMRIRPLLMLEATPDNYPIFRQGIIDESGDSSNIVVLDQFMPPYFGKGLSFYDIASELTELNVPVQVELPEIYDNPFEEIRDELLGEPDYFTLLDVQSLSKLRDKPMVIYFTAYTSVNCRKMEKAVLNDPDVLLMLHNDVVFRNAYIDESTTIPEQMNLVDDFTGDPYDTFGQYYTALQEHLVDLEGVPAFVFLSSDLEVIGIATYESHGDSDKFFDFLNECLLDERD